jgi:hypothetical protein
MVSLRSICVAGLLAGSLLGCGGGSGGSAGADSPTSLAPPASGTPSALVLATRPAAIDLVGVGKRSANAAHQPGGSDTTVVGTPVVTVNGNTVTIVSATVNANYGVGWVKVEFSDWSYDDTNGQPSSGSLLMTASNGTRISIVVVPLSGFQVDITVSGITIGYSLPF